MKKISLDDFFRLRRLVFRGARPLDYARWKFLFEKGSCDDLLSVLASYQNGDGGFGFCLECNNWNPASSPYTVCIALDYLDITEGCESAVKGEIVAGILRYLDSGAYLLEDGWVGMQGIPGNNDFSHMPWFHFKPEKAAKADIGVTRRLADFVLQYGERDSALCRRAEELKERYRQSGLFLLHGYPDYDPEALNIKDYDPAAYPAWLPLPVYFIGSPESSYYPDCKSTVERNLDTIVESLLNTHELKLPDAGELEGYERINPHPEQRGWGLAEQTIGNYYWGSNFIIRDLDLLSKFGRLDFDLPVLP